jgi:hypothetical protein
MYIVTIFEVLSFNVTAPVPEPPREPSLSTITVPEFIVNPLVKVFAPDKNNTPFPYMAPLFCTTPVTLVPILELIVTIPCPDPELVTVPTLLIAPVEIVTVLRSLLLIITSPVPVIPPVIVIFEVVVAIVSALFKVIAPLNVGVLELVIVAVPLDPEATVMGLANVKFEPPIKVALAVPVVSPIVIVLLFAPKALALVVPVTVPFLMVSPLVKVFVPDKVKLEVVLSCTTPVTFVPITALIEQAPVPDPL